MKVVIVIPTYNEKEAIEPIVEAIFHQDIPNHEIHIEVVDDNSPDGTAEIVEGLIQKFPRLHLVRGEKNGIGDAYIRGFKAAIVKLAPDVLFEMDADGQHPPEYIKPMLEAIEQGADVAVGTRYIKGGSIPKEWGVDRKFLSQFGNIVARVALLLPKYHDMTTGFRATRTEYLKKIDLDALLSKRFAYKIHLFYLLHKTGAKIVEVPFNFVERDKGKSKISKTESFDSLRVVLTISIIEHKQIIKFLFVGTFGFIVSAVVLTVLNDTVVGFFLPPAKTPGSILGIIQLADVRLFWSTLISLEISIVSNFLWHENWTYKHRSKNRIFLYRFGQFNLSSVVSPIISLITVNILTPHFGVPKLISLGIGTLIGLVWNYIINMLWIWRAKDPDEELI